MLGTYASAALICAASLLVGRAFLTIAGRNSWSWLEPAVGLAALLTVTGVLARAPGHATSATLGAALLTLAGAAVVARSPRRSPGALADGMSVLVALGLILSIPFAISGRWGPLGVGFNNDLGLHLAWAEWLRSGFGPTPEAGYPLGPHALADAVAAVPGIGLGQAFVGEIFAISVLTGLTALAALRDLGRGRRVLAAVLVAVPYLGASYYAQGAFKETAEALFVLAFAVGLADFDRLRSEQPGQGRLFAPSAARWALPYLVLAAGIFFSYSFAGLAWPIAVLALWGLTVPDVRRGLRPRALLRILLRPSTLAVVAALAALAVVATLVGPFGFAGGFNRVAGSNTYGPVSPVETLGIWPASNYRLDAPGGAHLTGIAGVIAVLALLLGLAWWLRRRELAIPAALAACAAVYLASLPFSGQYSQAKALMIAAPLAMLVVIRPLLAELPRSRRRSSSHYARRTTTSSGRAGWIGRLGWAVLAIAFVAGAAWSSFLVLRDAPVGPRGHGGELRAFLPILHGEPVLYAGQDRYAAHELMGADTHVPLVEFPDEAVSPNPEKPFDTGDAYSPIDFDSFSPATLARFPYVITGRAAWNSQAPANFRRVAATPSFVLWKNVGRGPDNRHVLLEGTEAGSRADCASPEIRILLSSPGRGSLFPAVVRSPKDAWEAGSILRNGERTPLPLSLPKGRWRLSLQYFSPFGLTLSAPGFRQELPAALDGQRPNTISLANNGQYWPAGEYRSKGGPVVFTLAAAQPSTLQQITGYAGKAYLGGLVAVAAGPRRVVSLHSACGGWIDWYESGAAP
jgi:hypothetical protein